MPKKHKKTFAGNSSSYVHPSLGTSRSTVSDQPATPLTVNERLQQMRMSNPSAELTQRQRDVAEGSSSATIPPELRTILGVPETAPPPPRRGARPLSRLRTPGPAPPPSWIFTDDTGHKRVHLTRHSTRPRSTSGSASQWRPTPKCLAHFLSETGQHAVDRRSLVHASLEQIARSWDEIDEAALFCLAETPNYIRTSLIAYIAYYGSASAGISARQVDVLVGGSQSLSCLDLSAQAGWRVPLRDLHAIFTRRNKKHTTKNSHTSEDLDAWDEEPVQQPSLYTHLASPVTLTALSLDQPPVTIQWTDLLNLTADLPTLTHLSISEWPWPTRTPHLAGSSYSSRDGRLIPASGSSYYSKLDGDFVEARVLLRQLSRNTRCLRYLNVSRCSWTPALLASAHEARGVISREGDQNPASQSWEVPSPSSGPDWGGAWKLVSRLHVGQETPDELTWVPSHISMGSSENHILKAVLSWLHESRACGPTDGTGEWRSADPAQNWICKTCHRLAGTSSGCRVCEIRLQDAERKVKDWVDKEKTLRALGRHIATAKRSVGGDAVTVEYGWNMR